MKNLSFISKLRRVSDSVKITIIYILLFVSTIVIGNIVDNKITPLEENTCIVLIVNTILFILLIKIFRVRFKTCKKFIIIVLLLMFIFIIENDYFLSAFQQSTPNETILSYFTYPLNFILLPFVCIFFALFEIGLFNLGFIIVPAYFIILLFICKKICKDK